MLKEKLCNVVKPTEYFIHPHCLQSFLAVQQHALLPVTEVAAAIVQSGHDQNLRVEEALSDAPGYPFLPVEELLFFEPYQGLGDRLLQALFAPQNLNSLLSPATLVKLAECFDKNWRNIADCLNTSETSKRMLAELEQDDHKTDISKCLEILTEWSARVEGTYSALHRDLGQYSIFRGRNPLVSFILRLHEALNCLFTVVVALVLEDAC